MTDTSIPVTETSMTRARALEIVQPVLRMVGDQLQGTRADIAAYDEAISLLGWLEEQPAEPTATPEPSTAPA